MNPLFTIPADFTALSEDELRSFVEGAKEVVIQVAASPDEFTSEERDAAALMAEATALVAAIDEARSELGRRETEESGDEEEGTEEESAPAAEAAVDADALAALAARATGEPETVETPAEEVTEPAAQVAELAVASFDSSALAEALKTAVAEGVKIGREEAAEDAVTAAADGGARRLGRPARSRRAEPQQTERELVPLTAAADLGGHSLGDPVDLAAAAQMMIERRRQFGVIPDNTRDDLPVVRANWSDSYDADRKLSRDEESNWEKVEAIVASAAAQREIKDRFEQRRNAAPSALTASGGLCAPVTPYYELAMISVADRPVRAALPAFNADRGGIRYARPAALSAITTGVGTKTVAQDAAGGTTATKTCQTVDCPAFQETDIEVIYHCLKFGNIGARTFPERVAQWNALVLAAHARTAETLLLDGIANASTAVTASDLGLGASAILPSQIITAAEGMRNRHRMDPEAVLRVLLPEWVLELLVTDVYRSQFDRFEMNEDSFVALLRDNDIEPTFYLDGATGAGQVFGAQSAGALLPFPSTIDWYLYPEGSFLYLDGGVLELGLVRDSTLNSTNDFEIFGETFENVAFTGVESLAVRSVTCNTGAVSLPKAVTSCVYS